ncbi:globin CTT-II beta-like [Chironomus tepperi]|uniref:globin CTT-II beta-like n=1 Tax=Chironomus tepperi TaxID=113505 RepID=UPI00391FA701
MKFLVLALCIAGAIAAPLSADQATAVRDSWNKVKHSEVDILYYIFKANPDIMAKFPQFVGKDIDSLKDTAAFATHAGRIVGFISEMIALMGNEANMPAMKTLIAEMASNHKSRGIPKAQFNEFRTSLMSYLESKVSFTDSLTAAWNQGMDNVFGMIFALL